LIYDTQLQALRLCSFGALLYKFCGCSKSSADANDTNGNRGQFQDAGYYSILLSVPAHTTIQAHSHRDDRVAVVVSGDWYFAYGDHFDAKLLKTLPPGSVYSEPGGQNHFARTEATSVVVEISGYGPTDTHYFDSANDPNSKGKK
jgi:hypothetical protein